MARPWPKKSAWPYVAKSGRKSYTIGFYDHEERERSRTFPSVRHARAWMDDYVTAERRGRDSLRRFLLDLDAREANETEARSIGEVLELYLAVNAHPRNEGGLAPSTYERYEWTIGRHLLDRPRRGPQGGRVAPPRYAVAPPRYAVAVACLWRASTRRRLRGRGVRTCCLRVCPSRRGIRRGACSLPL